MRRTTKTARASAVAAVLALPGAMLVSVGVASAPAQAAPAVATVRTSDASVTLTSTIRTRKGAKCVLKVSKGKSGKPVRLPAVKAVKRKAGWSWATRKASKRTTVRTVTVCRAKGKVERARSSRVVPGVVGGRSEIVIAGSVAVTKGRAVKRLPAPLHHQLPGSKGGGVNPGDRGWCTWGAWNLAPWLGSSVRGNANNWARSARASGLRVGTTPVVGSVFVYEGGAAGHVGVVTAVNGRQFTIKDMNGGAYATSFAQAGEAKNMGAYGRSEWAKYGSWMTVNFGRYALHTKTVDGYTKFIYRPGAATPSTPAPKPAPAPAPAPKPTPAPAPKTWAQTTGGVANTWTNYRNAGGTKGATIAARATVQVSCRVSGFRVANGNTWWYRIASSPWNNSYYVSADAFYNNGATSGPLKGTPYVDTRVALC